MKKKRFTEEQIIGALKAHEVGEKVVEVEAMRDAMIKKW